MSKKGNSPDCKSAEYFVEIVRKAMPSTTILYFDRDNSKLSAKPIPGISKMQGIKCSSSSLEYFANDITPKKEN